LIDKKGWPVANMLEAGSARAARRMYGEVLIANGITERAAPILPDLPAGQPEESQGAQEPPSVSPPKSNSAPKSKSVPKSKAASKPAKETKPLRSEAPTKRVSPERASTSSLEPSSKPTKQKPLPARGSEGLADLSIFQLRDRPLIKDRGRIGPPKLADEGTVENLKTNTPADTSRHLTEPRPNAKEITRRRSRRR